MKRKVGIGIIVIAGIAPMFGLGLIWSAVGALFGAMVTVRGE